MRLLLLLACGCAYSQTCQYQTIAYPSGAVQIFRNGALLRQGVDFAYTKPAGKNPLVSPLAYSIGDKFTAVFPRKLTLSLTIAGAPVPYTAYQDVIESWTCDSGNTGPAPWVPPTCTFADPPAAPVPGETCVFLDSDLFRSCQGAAAGRPVGQETCRWVGDHWQTTALPVESPLFPFTSSTSRAVECTTGLVPFTAINSGTASFDYGLFLAPGSVRWDHVMVTEADPFTSGLGLTVSMGRPGTNNQEMTGTVVPLGVSGAPWYARPIPPQISGSYSVSLNFRTADGHLLQELTAGTLYWEACGYRVGPVVTSPPRLVKLAQCSGSSLPGVVPGWDCTGLMWAKVQLGDGSILSLLGVEEVKAGTPAILTNWAPVQ